MKVFVVIGADDYEGYSDPEGVFSTRELAIKAAKKLEMVPPGRRFPRHDRVDILEYELEEEKAENT